MKKRYWIIIGIVIMVIFNDYHIWYILITEMILFDIYLHKRADD